MVVLVPEQELQPQEVASAHLEHLRHAEEVAVVERVHLARVGRAVADVAQARRSRKRGRADGGVGRLVGRRSGASLPWDEAQAERGRA